MITKVDNVIIGNEFITNPWVAATEGQIVMANENFGRFDSSAAALYIGVCTGTDENDMPIIRWSDRIQKESHPRFSFAEYKAPKAAMATINFTNAKIVAGHRYVIRILYKDIEAANLQFTHTYEVIAASADATELATTFQTKINKHANKRVNATLEGSVLKLTAKEKNYDNSVNALDEYSIVSMQVSMYTTIPGALLSNQPENVSGAVIENVAGNPGSGYWKQVRDMERRAMGYRGHVMTGAYPAVEQEMLTEKDGKYNIIVIENDNLYVSPDNQYIKTTPVRTIVCATSNLAWIVEYFKDFGMLNIDAIATEE